MRSRMIALVLVVAAFTGLLGAFLVERRQNEQWQGQVAVLASEGDALREQTWALEREIAELEGELKTARSSEPGSERWDLEKRIEALTIEVNQLTNRTRWRLEDRNRLALVGLSMREVAAAQGVALGSLVEMETDSSCVKYYDKANRCYYWVVPLGTPLENSICVGYSARFDDWFGADYKLHFDAFNSLVYGYWRRSARDGFFYSLYHSSSGVEYEVLHYTGAKNDDLGGELALIDTAAALRQTKPQLETETVIMEKAALLGLTMGEVAQAQGINLNTLSPLDSFVGYDQFYDGLYGYRLDWVDGDKALGERICHGIFGTIADMTRTSADELLTELSAIFNVEFVWQESESEGFCAYTAQIIADKRQYSIMVYTEADRHFTEEYAFSITSVIVYTD